MAPDQRAIPGCASRSHNSSSANLFIFFRREARNDQIARLAHDKKSVPIFDDERRGAAHLVLRSWNTGGRHECFPDSRAVFELHATKLALHIGAVRVTVLDK